jgi:hypothetical protein
MKSRLPNYHEQCHLLSTFPCRLSALLFSSHHLSFPFFTSLFSLNLSPVLLWGMRAGLSVTSSLSMALAQPRPVSNIIISSRCSKNCEEREYVTCKYSVCYNAMSSLKGREGMECCAVQAMRAAQQVLHIPFKRRKMSRSVELCNVV